MTLTLELTAAQMDALAEAVAAKLAGEPQASGDALTVAEAAKRLRVSKLTVYRRTQAGLIPTIPNLGVVRIPAAAIDRMLMKEGRDA
jgi:excisionase family DNA binding protein